MKHMLAALVLISLLALPSAARAEDKIAVVNVTQVIFGVREFETMKNAWTVKTSEMEKEENNLKNELTSKQTQRDQTMKPGTPEYEKLTLDLLKMQNEGNFKLQLERALMAGQQKQAINALFGKIKTAVDDLAKERGYTLVLNDFKPQITEQALNEMNINQFINFMLQSSTIMYTNTDTTITDEIIDRLDAAYSAEPAKTE